MNFKELFDKLTEGQKASIRRKYVSLFGSRATFYRKIASEVRVRPAETLFFTNHLTEQNASTES